jgi:hypothetical protein
MKNVELALSKPHNVWLAKKEQIEYMISLITPVIVWRAIIQSWTQSSVQVL